MFGSMKKAMVAGAIVAVGALAGPAMASAGQWTTNGSTPFAGAAKANGQYTIKWAGGFTSTCDVEVSLDLSNPGGVAQGDVTGFTSGAGAGGLCSSTFPNCPNVNFDAYEATLPWTVTTSGASLTIANLAFHYTQSGPGCVLTFPMNLWGSIAGSVVGDTLSFDNAGPLTTTLGSSAIDAELSLTDANDNPVSMF